MEKPMTNAIELLKEDHAKVRGLLKKLCDSTQRAHKTRAQLLAEIEMELQIHTTIEEEIFYPAFKAAGGKEESVMFYEAVEEHRAVDELVMPDLKKTDAASERFSGRAKVLKELIEHHADEEEKDMFPRAKKLFSKAELETLGEEMKLRKEAMKADLKPKARRSGTSAGVAEQRA
jgi:hemerythrin-like domain-containing protein